MVLGIKTWTSLGNSILPIRASLVFFQYSCLENPMDRGAWWATVHRVAKSWTQLNDLTNSNCSSYHSAPSDLQRFMSILCAKYNHPITTSIKFSTNYSIKSKLKISSKFHQLRSPKFHYFNHLNWVWASGYDLC